MKADMGSSRIAAVHMTTSLRYICPPGTGTPKELAAMFSAIRQAATVMTLSGTLADETAFLFFIIKILRFYVRKRAKYMFFLHLSG